MRTLTFGFVVGTDFHHYLFAFGFCGEGWIPGVREGGGVERRGFMEVAIYISISSGRECLEFLVTSHTLNVHVHVSTPRVIFLPADLISNG